MDKQDIFNFIYGTCGFGMMCLLLAAIMHSAVWIRVLFAVVTVVALATLAIDNMTSGD